MSVRPTPIQYKCSRAGLSLHTAAADDWPDPTHTHTKAHSYTLSRHTHSSYHTLTEALKLRPALGDATGWQSLSKSTFPPLCSSFSSLPAFVVIAILRPRLSSFISQPLSSVAVKWPVFSQTERLFKLFSQYAMHIPFSPLPAFLSFLCMWAEAEADPGPICMLAQSQAWMPLYLNNRAERMDVDLPYSHFVLVWYLSPGVSVWVVIACD